MVQFLQRVGAALAGAVLFILGSNLVSGMASADAPQPVVAGVAVQPEDGEDFESDSEGGFEDSGDQEDRQPAPNNIGGSQDDDDERFEPDDGDDDTELALGGAALGGIGLDEIIRWLWRRFKNRKRNNTKTRSNDAKKVEPSPPPYDR